MGKAFGMTDFINSSESSNKSISELVNEMTGGLGVDYSFECTGVPSLINEALQATKVVRLVSFFSFLVLFITPHPHPHLMVKNFVNH